ncbi:MAG TPA: hydantoinase/oxoprolinase family protein [Gaiellaceae bacterium]|nr:hydantoinase/oxoprolinase family protein [Gaiellaceae bacterium]
MTVEAEAGFRAGLDIGGTFTDLAVYDPRLRQAFEFKSLTTPDPVECVGACLEKAAAHFSLPLGEFMSRIELLFCFGSTIGVNTLLTEAGARVGIVTTKGHRDAYHIAEMDRQGIHDVRDAAEGTFRPLVPRSLVVEVAERIDYSGRIVIPLNEDEVASAVTHLVEDQGAEALVVSFLWAHRVSAHEERAREIALELYPRLFVTIGSEISGTLGEFTRLATAVINAYIGKRVEEQASRLRDFLTSSGLRVPLLVMQMVGGVAPLEEIVKRPVALLKSGPAGGAVAGGVTAAQVGERNVVCIDMGGTSLDVSRITDGEVQITRGFSILKHPIAMPGVEIESVGAGGGSIAVLERAGTTGRLRVGPESAGSSPGPACYGLGGELPTVTDANVVLGIIDPDVPLGGEIRLDAGRARTAIASRLAEPMGLDVEAAAWGVYQVVTAQMADAIESTLISNGVDPRDYSLMAFGAAGPAHAAAIGARLGVKSVIVPAFSPVFSAFGLMTTDIRHAYHLTDTSVSVPLDGTPALAGEAAHVAERLRLVSTWPLQLLEREQVPLENRELALYVDLRYSGQELQLAIEVPPPAAEGEFAGEDLRRVVAAWEEKYVRVYGEGAAWSEGSIEIVNYRAVGIGRIDPPVLAPRPPAANGGGAQPIATRRLYLGDWVDAAVHRLEDVARGVELSGPAAVTGELTTVLLGPGDTASVDGFGHLHLVPGDGWSW